MLDDWVRVYSSQYLYKIEIAKAILEDNDIESVSVNKQDYAYGFGEIELYTKKSNALRAVNIIKEIKYE